MKSKLAKQKVWAAFDKKYPNADKSKSLAKVSFEKDHTPTADIFFKGGGPYLLQSVVKLDSKFWSQAMKDALRIDKHVVGFPHELSPSGLKGSSVSIPAMPFYNKIPSLKEIFSKPINIFVTPDQFLTTKFREIFQQTKLHTVQGRVEIMAWRTDHGLLAATAQLCNLVRDYQLRDFSRNFRRPLRQFHHRSQLSTGFTSILLPGGSCFRWVGFRTSPPFPMTPRSTRMTTSMTRRRTKDFGVDPKTDFRYTQG